MNGEVAALASLKKVEQLLLWGKREEAVQEALASNNFAMALLVASMCDRTTFQEATKQFADEILSKGSPLHTLAMLFSGQLQPPADSALDRTGTKRSIWEDGDQNLSSAWRQHLAATISNRTLGWDRIVLALGDHLLESGNVAAAHFCYMVCGCPVTSLLHPSSRMCLVGCDHVVPMDAALMTPEGVAGYERTEAYEWAKRRGNPNAAIPSLQPFKLMYAMLLADMGLESYAQLYVHSIRQCCGLDQPKEGYAVANAPATVWALSVGDNFKAWLNEFEDRLGKGNTRSQAQLQSSPVTAKPATDGGAGPFLPTQPPAINKDRASKDKKKTKRMSTKLSPRRSNVISMDTVSEDKAFAPEGNSKEEDVNATFLSAQSNLLDVTACSTGETSAPPMKSDGHQAFAGAASRKQKLDPRASSGPPAQQADIGAPPSTPGNKLESILPKMPVAAKREEQKKSIKPPPNSAPALLGATKTDKSVTGSPQKAPSSDKSKFMHGLPERWLLTPRSFLSFHVLD